MRDGQVLCLLDLSDEHTSVVAWVDGQEGYVILSDTETCLENDRESVCFLITLMAVVVIVTGTLFKDSHIANLSDGLQFVD